MVARDQSREHQSGMSTAPTVRPMQPADLPETLDMWVAAWQKAYPAIDFSARRGWATNHFAELERTGSRSFVAVDAGRIVGALVVNPETGYLDQLVVATTHQNRGVATLLIAQAHALAPRGLELHVNQDNAGAIRFYERRGFAVTGEDVNLRSGAAIFRMSWRP